MRIIFIIVLLIGLGPTSAQSDFIMDPSVLSNSGGVWLQNEYNVSFTIGEIAIETFDNYGDYVFTQGFHQDNYQIINVVETNYDSQISVFPNPTEGRLTVTCQELNKSGDLHVKDINGRTIYSVLDFSTNEIQFIELSRFSQGIYFVEILIESNQKTIYQIQKIN